MNNKLLPLGSVLSLNDDKDKLMLVAYKAKSPDNDRIFDYAGVRFPEGLMEDYYILFDSNAVSEVFFEGYNNEELEEYGDKVSYLSSADSSNSLQNYSSSKERGKAKGRRAPGQPTKPLGKSEMYSKYTKEVISGGQSKKFDFSELNK